MAELKEQSGMSDAEAIAAVCAGNERAMEALYIRYSRVVYSVALRVVCDSNAAEDILQDVFMQLWRNPQAFNGSRGNLAPWLAVITRNRAIDFLRKHRPELDSADTVIAVDGDLENTILRNQAVQKIRAIVASMPPEQKQALEMAFYEGLSHAEIAQKTGQPLGTVKTRIRSGLLAVRKAVAA